MQQLAQREILFMAPKSRWLAERIAKEIRERHLKQTRPGGRLLPVRELARELGVCVRTVLAAQRILAERGELEIRHGSGAYLPEQSGPRWAGVFTAFNILQPHASIFQARVAWELSRQLEEYGIPTEFYIGRSTLREDDPPSSCGRLMADAQGGRLEGLAILSCPATIEWRRTIESLRIPCVGSNTPYRVEMGYADMLRRAVRHLSGQGCRRIAMLAWERDGLREPLRRALRECGLEYRPEWVRHDLHPMLSGAGWEEFREIWTASREKPDGLVAADDVLFDEAARAIQELGIRVPDHLRVVAHANKGADRRYPFPVTEALVDPQRYAQALSEMLIRRMRGEPVAPRTITLPFEIVDSAAAGNRVVLCRTGIGATMG